MTNAPYFADVAKGPEGGYAQWVTASDGVRLRVGFWPKDGARGTVLIFPGRTEYIEKYSDAAREFADRGYASVAIDWRGQGLADRFGSDPKQGHVEAFSDYQKDVAALLEVVKAAGLPEPFHLLAHSMGGCIGLRACMNGLPVKTAAFSAPMWGLTLAPHLWVGAWTASTLAAMTGQTKIYAPGTDSTARPASVPFDENRLTTDRAMYEWMQGQVVAHPELLLGGPSLGWLNTALREMHRLAREPALTLPGACWLGTRENIVDPAAIHIRMNAWDTGTLHICDGALHEVMMEGAATRSAIFDGCVALYDG